LQDAEGGLKADRRGRTIPVIYSRRIGELDTAPEIAENVQKEKSSRLEKRLMLQVKPPNIERRGQWNPTYRKKGLLRGEKAFLTASRQPATPLALNRRGFNWGGMGHDFCVRLRERGARRNGGSKPYRGIFFFRANL